MVKKILKGLGIFLLLTVIALAAAPFLFKDKIKALVLKTINENVDATVAFTDDPVVLVTIIESILFTEDAAGVSPVNAVEPLYVQDVTPLAAEGVATDVPGTT